jgi:hypothetical protein
MKTVLLIIALLGVTGMARAQAPRLISYQGFFTDASGTPISDGSHLLTITLYDAAVAGTLLWSESHNAITVRGIFSISLGSSTPIPLSLAFDRPYWLGVSVDGGAEMTPRTALTSSPYALNAGAGGQGVTSLNGQSGVLTLQGAGGTVVTQSGNAITITSSGGSGGTGIQGVQNSDGSIAVTAPTGPVATLNIADGGVTVGKIADGSVTDAKIVNVGWGKITGAPSSLPPGGSAGGSLSGSYPNPNIASGAVTSAMIADGTIGAADLAAGIIPTTLPPSGAAGGDLAGTYPNPTVSGLQGRGISNAAPTNGQVLAWSGTQWAPTTIGGLVLPYSGTVSSASSAFAVYNSGSGVAGRFLIANTGNSRPALAAESTGSGPAFQATADGTGEAGSFEIKSNINSASSISSITNGTGEAGAFEIDNVSNSASAISSITNGTGYAGRFQINNGSSSYPAVYGVTNGSGNGVRGNSTSSGASLAGFNSGTGSAGSFTVYNASNSSDVITATTNGTGNAGDFSITNSSSNAEAIYGSTNGGGNAVEGYTTGTGRAGNFRIVNGNSTSFALYASTSGSGHALYGFTNSGGHAVYSAGTAYKTSGGSAWAIPSDVRLKSDVAPFNDGLDVLLRIEPKRYHYNGSFGTQKQREEIGVIAQDIQKIAPYMIEPRMMEIDPNDPASPREEILTFNNGALSYITINAIRELHNRLATIEQAGGSDSTTTLSKIRQRLDRMSAEDTQAWEELRQLRAENAVLRESLGKLMERLQRLESSADSVTQTP